MLCMSFWLILPESACCWLWIQQKRQTIPLSPPILTVGFTKWGIILFHGIQKWQCQNLIFLYAISDMTWQLRWLAQRNFIMKVTFYVEWATIDMNGNVNKQDSFPATWFITTKFRNPIFKLWGSNLPQHLKKTNSKYFSNIPFMLVCIRLWVQIKTIMINIGLPIWSTNQD